jgi:hypothetical protein
MRDHLIGYLLGALEPTEHEQVEAQLTRDAQLQRELELLSSSLLVLAANKEHCDPPPGLAARTCAYVSQHGSEVSLPLAPPAASPRPWSMADMLVAAGIFIAASLLFFPAVNQSRFAARVTQCQNNLRQFGLAMHNYSQLHGGFFPNVPLDGETAAAGIVAVRLHDLGFLDGSYLVICPDSALADEGRDFRMPSEAEVRVARGPQLLKLRERMGGSLGFNLGFIANGKYYSPRNLGRVRYALVADAPSAEPPYHSHNHGGCGQNVLFEDQHVEYLTTCRAHGCRDDIYTNDEGAVRPGLHLHDAVIGASHARPEMGSVLLEIRQKDAR